MTKGKEWEDLEITSCFLDVEIIRPLFFSLFLWTIRQTWLVMGIPLCIESASSGIFFLFCRLSLLVLCYELAAVVLVGASITDFFFFTLMELYELRISIMNRKGDALADFACVCLACRECSCVCLRYVWLMLLDERTVRYRSVRDVILTFEAAFIHTLEFSRC